MDTKMKNTVKKVIPVTGMNCAACAVSVQSMAAAQEGVVNASVNFAAQTLQVEYDPEKINPGYLQKVIQSIGYDLIVDEDNAAEQQAAYQQREYAKLRRYTIFAAILAVSLRCWWVCSSWTFLTATTLCGRSPRRYCLYLAAGFL